MALFEGIIPAVPTPFDASGAIDETALERNVAAYLDAGVHGLVANGTMGEAGSLSAEERRTVVAGIARGRGGGGPGSGGGGAPGRRRPRAGDRRRVGRDAVGGDRVRRGRRRGGGDGADDAAAARLP